MQCEITLMPSICAASQWSEPSDAYYLPESFSTTIVTAQNNNKQGSKVREEERNCEECVHCKSRIIDRNSSILTATSSCLGS